MYVLQVGLYDLQGDTPVLKRVPLNPTSQLELEQAMPLNRLLARVSDYKVRLGAVPPTPRPSLQPWPGVS